MPTPKKKLSRRRTAIQRNKRYFRVASNTIKCKKCGADKLPHRVCPECGSRE